MDNVVADYPCDVCGAARGTPCKTAEPGFVHAGRHGSSGKRKPHSSELPCNSCGNPVRALGMSICMKCATGRELSETEVLHSSLVNLTAALNNIAAAIREHKDKP